jgi:hypothetical protein
MVDCWKHSSEERPQTSELIERLEKLVSSSAISFQDSAYWVNSTSMRRGIRQPSPFIPSAVELEKFWDEIDSSSNSPFRTESKKRGRERDNDINDSSVWRSKKFYLPGLHGKGDSALKSIKEEH